MIIHHITKNIKKAALDAKQKRLSIRIFEFKDQLMKDIDNKKADKQVQKQYALMTKALDMLYDAAKILKKQDNSLFLEVLKITRALQGDSSGTIK